jgi:hypothetical protein
MRALCGIVGLLAVLGIGWHLYSLQVAPVVKGGAPASLINTVGVKNDLLSLAQCERFYLAAHGRYGDMEQLRQAGDLNPFPGDNHRGYDYEIEIEGAAHFRITAKPADPAQADLPTLSIDETMQIRQ